MQALAGGGAQLVTVQVGPGELDRRMLAAGIGPAVTNGVCGVMSLLALAEAPLPGHPGVPAGLAGTQALVQALGDADIAAPLWVLTCGAVAAGPGEVLASPVQAMAWGLGRVAALEHPGRWGGLVDLPPAPDDRAAARLRGVLAGCGEDQAAIRGTGIWARRLARAPQPRHGQPWVPGGTVLVTGGTGAIGGHVARWAAGRGAPRVVLASRSGPAAPGAAALAAALAAAGTAAAVTACDTADRAQTAALVARIAAAGPPLAAVMHAAGTGQYTPLADTTTAELAAVTAAKTAGAAHLDELTAGLDLEQFVLFSSVAATWGSGSQPGYAAANAYLDALALARAGRGQPASSVAWGMWAGGGMAGGEGATHLLRRGLNLMNPALAITALGQAIDGGQTQITVADVDWARFTPPFTLRRPSPLIADLPEVRQALADTQATTTGKPPAPAAGTALGRQLAGLPPADQHHLLTELIRAEAAAILGHPSPDAVQPARAFRDLGFDSVTAIELRNRLAATTALALPATLIFDYPTPTLLSRYLQAKTIDREAEYQPVLKEIENLECTLSEVGANNDERSKILTRLEAVVQDFRTGTTESVSAYQEIDTATDEEMFNLIDKELGI